MGGDGVIGNVKSRFRLAREGDILCFPTHDTVQSGITAVSHEPFYGVMFCLLAGKSILYIQFLIQFDMEMGIALGERG